MSSSLHFLFVYFLLYYYYYLLFNIEHCGSPDSSTYMSIMRYFVYTVYIITMFSQRFIVTANQYLIPNRCCNEALSVFLHFLKASLSLCLFLPLFLPLSLSLLFPLSGGLPAMSPWLLL